MTYTSYVIEHMLEMFGKNYEVKAKKLTVVSEVFHPNLTPDSNLSTLCSEKLSAKSGN